MFLVYEEEEVEAVASKFSTKKPFPCFLRCWSVFKSSCWRQKVMHEICSSSFALPYLCD